MPDHSLQDTAQSYLRMIAIGRLLAKLPIRLAYPLAARIAASRSPFRERADDFFAYASAIKLPKEKQHGLWSETLHHHGMFFVNHFLHASKPGKLLQTLDDSPAAWQAFLAQPGPALVLTCHHEFYHTLLVISGLSGKRVYFVAAPEDSGPLAPWLLPHIRQQHVYCARHFNGGSYLFKNRKAAVRQAFEEESVVFSMHDFHAPGPDAHEIRLFDRTYQVPAGTVELALEYGIPIYFGALVWDDTTRCYHPDFQRLNPNSAQPMRAYAEAMSNFLSRHPTSWHGWQWFCQFPERSP